MGAISVALLLGMLLIFLAGCSKESGEKEAAVPVQIVSVDKNTPAAHRFG